MPLLTKRLMLRAVTANDLTDLFRIYGDPETNTFNPAGPLPDIERANDVLTRWLAHWQVQGFGEWAIATQEAPETVIGFGGLTHRTLNDLSFINLGYRFATQAWGKGYATELARFALEHGFLTHHFPTVSAYVRPAHLASKRVLEKVGMRFIKEIDDVPNAAPSLLLAIDRDTWLQENNPAAR